MGDMQSAIHLAILAPVPDVHLKSAPKGGPKVAFATTDWKLFGKDLKELRTKTELTESTNKRKRIILYPEVILKHLLNRLNSLLVLCPLVARC